MKDTYYVVIEYDDDANGWGEVAEKDLVEHVSKLLLENYDGCLDGNKVVITITRNVS